jgi:butyrate kinase
MEHTYILAIKPENFITRIAVYHSIDLIFLKVIKHRTEELAMFPTFARQFQLRADAIIDEISKANLNLNNIQTIVGRGGLLKPIKSGVYSVNEKMKQDLLNNPVGNHPVNLGALIADAIAAKIEGAKAFIADPVVVDELCDLARMTGLPFFKRESIYHALNHKAIARKHANSISKNYKDLNLIVANLGDGISVAAHCLGKVIDVNQSYDGEGPFSLESAGTLPAGDLVKLCFSGKFSEDEILTMLRDKGGLSAYTGSSSFFEFEKALSMGDSKIKFYFEAMAYHISKNIASLSAVLKGHIDAILLTGNMASNKWFMNLIIERIQNLAPVYIYPGEDVLESLALNGLMVIKGEVEVLEYT